MMRSNRLVPFATWIAMFCLVGIIAWELAPERGDPNRTPEVPKPHLRPDSNTEVGSGERIGRILERPLFTPTRRTFQMVTPAHLAEDPGVEALPRLSGIAVMAGGELAVFQTSRSEKPITLRTGADLDGWRIEAITPEGVIVARADERVLLIPKVDPELASERSNSTAAASPDPGAPQPAGTTLTNGPDTVAQTVKPAGNANQNVANTPTEAVAGKVPAAEQQKTRSRIHRHNLYRAVRQ